MVKSWQHAQLERFFEAVESGNTSLVERAIGHGIEINAIDVRCFTLAAVEKKF
jgi:hypothetical protein